MRFWAAQRWDGRGDIDYDEGYEVCKEGDKGVDGSPAFPVFDIPQATPPAATAAPELTDAKDAARYRRLRDGEDGRPSVLFNGRWYGGTNGIGFDLDAAMDAAIAQQGEAS